MEIKSYKNQKEDKTWIQIARFEPELNSDRLLLNNWPLAIYYAYSCSKAAVDISQENFGPKSKPENIKNTSNHKPSRLPKLPRGKVTKNYKLQQQQATTNVDN